jgi:hypothetical protein
VALSYPPHDLAKLTECGDELLPTALVERDDPLRRLTAHCEKES